VCEGGREFEREGECCLTVSCVTYVPSHVGRVFCSPSSSRSLCMLAMVPMLIVPHLNPCARSCTEGGMGLLSPRASPRLAKRMSSPHGGGPVIDSGAALLPPAFDRVRRMALVHRLKELRAMRAIVYPPPGRWGEGAHAWPALLCRTHV
jgi:hypothetical protein